PAGDRVRLYLYPTTQAEAAQPDANYLEVSAASVAREETVPDPAIPTTRSAALPHTEDSSALYIAASASVTPLTAAEMHQLLARAGQAHNIDADLLASVVHA